MKIYIFLLLHFYCHECLMLISMLSLMKGLLEARQELQPSISNSSNRLKDLLFLDIALDSTIRTATERGYEELNNAQPEVPFVDQSVQISIAYFTFSKIILCICFAENHLLH